MENVAPNLRLSVSDFVALTNQTLEYAYPAVEVEGEIANFKINQGKYVFFDLKDDESRVGCFMMAWQLRAVLEDGMRVVVAASPKLTAWGKFSLTVRTVRPSGEGSLKKGFELLKAKLASEGLFEASRKRALPFMPVHVAVISSPDAAGYADFMKLVNERWGGLTIDVVPVQVQGVDAPDQMIRALQQVNSVEVLPEVVVLLRGGGSADDLAAFNDELLVREIAASRVPVLVGVGHETDVSLADLAADKRAATPSHAAQLLVPDRREVRVAVRSKLMTLPSKLERELAIKEEWVHARLASALDAIEERQSDLEDRRRALQRLLKNVDPRTVLARGYALVRGEFVRGSSIEIETHDKIVKAEVQHVSKK